MVWRGGFVRRPQTIDMGMCFLFLWREILTTRKRKASFVLSFCRERLLSKLPVFQHCVFTLFFFFKTVLVVVLFVSSLFYLLLPSRCVLISLNCFSFNLFSFFSLSGLESSPLEGCEPLSPVHLHGLVPVSRVGTARTYASGFLEV